MNLQVLFGFILGFVAGVALTLILAMYASKDAER